jgi:methyl-accepting chemotaxis protein
MNKQHVLHAPATKAGVFANLSIRKKLLLNAAVPLLLLAAFALWLWLGLTGMQQRVSEGLTAKVQFALLAKDLERNVVQVQQFLSDVSATRGQDGLDDGFKLAGDNRAEFLANVARFRDHLKSQHAEDQLQALESVSVNFEIYFKAGVEMAHAYVDGGPSEGNKLMPAFDKASETLQDGLDAFVKAEITKMDADVAGVSDQATAIKQAALVLSLVVGALVLLASWALAGSVLRPVQLAADVASRIAQGDLRPLAIAKTTDEIGVMLSSMGTMRDSLRELVSQVQMGIDKVGTSSSELAVANGELSERNERQAAALEQTSASMQQLGETVSHNAANADSANRMAEHACEVAASGGRVVAEVVQTMEGINATSRRVSEIVGVIDGIAFQTNILALNAAVEAARAGEQGRGFAVVASEVRSLAGRCSEAAREIRQLISSSVQQLDSGTVLVARAGATMGDVVASIERVTTVVRDISAAGRDQSASVSEVAQAVALMDEATQQNAALVEQTAAAADSLKGQAQQLVQAVRVFNLGGAGSMA